MQRSSCQYCRPNYCCEVKINVKTHQKLKLRVHYVMFIIFLILINNYSCDEVHATRYTLARVLLVLLVLLLINTFYADIIYCVSKAVNDLISCRVEFNIPGSNTYYVKGKREIAFVIWLDAGKPKCCYYFDAMKRHELFSS